MIKTAVTWVAATAVLIPCAALADEGGWPKLIEPPEAEIVLYQPQLENLEGDVLTGRSAVMVTPKDATDPIFGVVWFSLGGELLYMSNTDSDVIMEIASQRHYVVLSGRWYGCKTLEGPWEYIPSEDLPDSFREIPADSDMGHLLAYVAGTQEAEDAVLDNQVPQTAAVKRDATIEVEYDGTPKFEDIEDTQMQYAINTSDSVIKTGGKYYCCREAVWYGDRATTRPDTGSRPSTGQVDRGSGGKTPSPSTGQRAGSGGGSSLNRDYQARQRGTTRTNNYNRSRSGGGGARRGGGRRR